MSVESLPLGLHRTQKQEMSFQVPVAFAKFGGLERAEANAVA